MSIPNPYGTDGAMTYAIGVDEESVIAQAGATYAVQCYLDDDGSVFGGRTLGNRQSVHFRAQDIQKDRFGAMKARVAIRLNDWPLLAWGTIHIDKHEDRTRICNLAFDKLDKTTKEFYSKDLMRHDFDQWCYWVWPTFLGHQDAEELAGEISPVKFLIHPYVIEGGGTILFGAPGGGKTYLALLMGISIDSGVNDLFKVDEDIHKVLFVNLERSSQSIRNRIAACNRVLGFPPDRPLLTMNQRGKSLADLREPIKAVVEKHGVKLIILDSISRATNGASLTEDTSGNKIIDTLNGLTESWVAIAHNTRGDASHVYGSMMFDAGADIIVKLTSQAEANKIGLVTEIVKANDVGRYPKKYVALEFDENGLNQVRSAQSGEFGELESATQSNAEKIHQFLATNGASSVERISAETGITPQSTRTYLSRMRDVIVVANTGGGFKVYGLQQEET